MTADPTKNERLLRGLCGSDSQKKDTVGSETQSNASNAYRNALVRGKSLCSVLEFLESRPTDDEWHCPFEIASKRCLNMPSGTVRASLKKLLDQNMVTRDIRGKYHLYAATRHFRGDFNRLIKTHPTGKLWEAHGITMKLEAKDVGLESFPINLCNMTPLGGQTILSEPKARKKGEPFRESYGVKDRGRTSIQVSEDTLMVYCGCTLEPMDYDRFLSWLKGLEVYLELKGLPRIDGNLYKWKIVECGFSQDGVQVENSKVSICLKTYDSWLARVYSKPSLGENVIRKEVHSREEVTAFEYLSQLSGGLAASQTNAQIGYVATSLNNNNFATRENTQAMVRVVQRLEASERLNKELLAERAADRREQERKDAAFLRLVSQLTQQSAGLTKQVAELAKEIRVPKSSSNVNGVS